MELLSRVNSSTGILIRADGTVTEISPKNGTDFKFEGELYDAINCEMIEIVRCDKDHIFICDEEGFYRNGATINRVASRLYQQMHDDCEIGLVGDVVLCLDNMVK